MFSKRWAPFLLAAFAILFNFAMPQASPGQFRRPPSLEEMTHPKVTTPEKAPAGPGALRVATSTQRIDRDRVEIRVYRNGKAVELFPHFHELVTATPTYGQMLLEKLVGTSVTLVPSQEHAEQWDVFTGVGGVGEQTLAANIFKVRQVLLSSRKSPIEIRVDGQVHRLKPGQALLVL